MGETLTFSIPAPAGAFTLTVQLSPTPPASRGLPLGRVAAELLSLALDVEGGPTSPAGRLLTDLAERIDAAADSIAPPLAEEGAEPADQDALPAEVRAANAELLARGPELAQQINQAVGDHRPRGQCPIPICGNGEFCQYPGDQCSLVAEEGGQANG